MEGNNNFYLVIDYRENDLKKNFEGKNNVLIENLDIGDIQIRNNSEIIFVIERKTICDLSSSIKDGRHREQKVRLLNSGINVENIMYLIEGDIDQVRMKCLPKTTITSSIINTLIRDKIKIYRSRNINESIEFIDSVFKKILKDPSILQSKTTDYISTIKLKKKDNLNSSNCYLLQLGQIPGSSVKIAECVSLQYPTMLSLCQKYDSIPEEERPKLLENMKYSIQNNKTRRIGKVLSERIYIYLSGKDI